MTILEGQGTRTEVIPRGAPDEDWKNHLVLDWTVLESGAAQVQGLWSVQTNDGALMRHQASQASAQQRDAFVRQVVARYAPGVNLTQFEIVDIDQVGAPIQIRFEGVRPDFLEPQGDLFKADLRLPGTGLSTGLGPSQRNWPLAARFVLKDRYQVSVRVPAGWSVAGGPQPFAEEHEGFEHRLEIELGASPSWQLERTFQLRGWPWIPRRWLASWSALLSLSAKRAVR